MKLLPSTFMTKVRHLVFRAHVNVLYDDGGAIKARGQSSATPVAPHTPLIPPPCPAGVITTVASVTPSHLTEKQSTDGCLYHLVVLPEVFR